MVSRGYESGATVVGSARKFLTFLACGIVAALLIGVLVWRLNTPADSTTAESGYDTSAGELTADSESLHTPRPQPTTEPTEAAEGAGAAPGPQRPEPATNDAPRYDARPDDFDPYLPPGAVALPAPGQASTPTRVIHPTDIVEMPKNETLAPAPGTTSAPGEPQPAPEPSANPTTSEPVPDPSTAEETSEAPGPSSTAPEEPSEPSPAEPEPRPRLPLPEVPGLNF